MTTDNFRWALRGFCSRAHFLPFNLELVSGVVLAVTHPEAVSLRGETVVFIRPDHGFQVFDALSVSQLYDRALATSQTGERREES